MNELQLEDYINLEQDMVNEHLRDACGEGDLELIEFLLTSDKMKNNGQLSYANSWPLKHACFNGQYEAVLFVIKLENLKENNKDYKVPLPLFKNFCVTLNSSNEAICYEIISYLIIEKNYLIDKTTYEILKTIGAEKICKLIDNNQLNKELNKSLTTNVKKEAIKNKM